MLVDENKRFLLRSFHSSTSNINLYIAASLSVSPEIGCKPPINVVGKFFSHATKNHGKRQGQKVDDWVTKVKFLNISRFKIL